MYYPSGLVLLSFPLFSTLLFPFPCYLSFFFLSPPPAPSCFFPLRFSSQLSCHVDLTLTFNVFFFYLRIQSPGDEYFHRGVLDITEGLHVMDGLRWKLVLALFGAWLITFLVISKGKIKSRYLQVCACLSPLHVCMHVHV